jgi:hypothetical protein
LPKAKSKPQKNATKRPSKRDFDHENIILHQLSPFVVPRTIASWSSLARTGTAAAAATAATTATATIQSCRSSNNDHSSTTTTSN